jgi:uncharacterized protein (DUF2141 family)
MTTPTTHRNNTLKVITLSIAFAFCTLLGFSQDTKTEGQTITVTVNNVKNDTGNVMVALHSVDTFMKGPGIQNLESDIKDGKITVTFKNVASGDYAIMVLHDENKNKRMDFDNGMPKESYGMSNNPISYGPPQFGEAKFEVAGENLDLNIRF